MYMGEVLNFFKFIALKCNELAFDFRLKKVIFGVVFSFY